MKFLLVLLLPFLSVHAQSETESTIKEIRRLFYSLKEAEMDKDSSRDVISYSQNNFLKKVVVDFVDERTEYYYDIDYNSEGAYFIFSFEKTENGKIENRYYFDRDGNLIRLID